MNAPFIVLPHNILSAIERTIQEAELHQYPGTLPTALAIQWCREFIISMLWTGDCQMLVHDIRRAAVDRFTERVVRAASLQNNLALIILRLDPTINPGIADALAMNFTLQAFLRVPFSLATDA